MDRARVIPLVLLTLAGFGAAPAQAASLRAGVAVVDITAEKPTVAVNDPLCAKALALDDGKTKAVIICLDLGGASSTLVASVRDRIQRQLAVKGSHILVNASHNHHTQGQVARDVVDRIVGAVKQASQTMVPVRVGAGVGREDRITMNRRLRLTSGKDWTIRRANPSPKDSDVAELGPIDPEIGILRLDRTSGEPLAVVYNFAAHAYGGVPSGGVTADFPGFASAVLEEALPGAKALFLQGFAGDVTPIRYKDVDAPPPTEQLGTMLGLSTLQAVNRIATQEQGILKVISETIEIPRRQDDEARIQSLETQQEEVLQFFTGVGCGTHGAGTFLNFKTFLPLYVKHRVDPDFPAYSSYLYKHEEATGHTELTHLDAENRRRVQKYLACIDNMERLIRIRSNLQAYKRHLNRRGEGPIAAEVQGIRIGSFLLVTFPGEPFAEVGLRVKEQSPFEYTFVAGYSNGHLGYAPTADAYDREAYEDALTAFAPEWQQLYEAEALEILRRLAAEEGAVGEQVSTAPERPPEGDTTLPPQQPVNPSRNPGRR